MNTPTNTDDIIDSRDVIEAIDTMRYCCDGADEALDFAALVKFAAEGEDYAPDWAYSTALIRDSYFEEYAQELAEDIGAIKADAGWPCGYIDWERAARDLQMDYTCVDFDGVTYWTR
ncbi:hypothetical protein LCGC14_1043080 [marine sediment metagenome]|uniref:Antirestriction protein n=1 Tax=marine sediment metagenome TaxID=412755 RepID=A0A0F9MR65_9ZZZZ